MGVKINTFEHSLYILLEIFIQYIKNINLMYIKPHVHVHAEVIIIIIMVIFKCYFSGEFIALSYKKKQKTTTAV